MKLFFNLLICLFVLPLGVFCQEKIRKFTVEPNDGQTRIVLSFVELTENDFKLQWMIIDLDAIKDKNEQSKSVSVDLTSTVRSSGSALRRNRKILLIRWNKNGEIEMKCDENWAKKESDLAAQKIVEATNSIIQNVPIGSKESIDISLPDEIVKKAEAVLDSLKKENFSCLRTLN